MALGKRQTTAANATRPSTSRPTEVGKASTQQTAAKKQQNTTAVGKASTAQTAAQADTRPHTAPVQTVSKAPTTTYANVAASGGYTAPVQNVGKADSSTYQAQSTNRSTEPVQQVAKSATPVVSETNPRPQTTYDIISPSTANNLISPSMAGNVSGILNNNPAGLSNSDIAAVDYDGTLGINPTPAAASQTFDQMTVRPNETPSQTTERYNGLLGALLGAATTNLLGSADGKGTGYGAAGRRNAYNVNKAGTKQDLAALNDLYETLDSTTSIGDRPYSTPNNVGSILGDVYNIDNDITSKGGNGGGGVTRRGDGLGIGPVGTGEIGIGNGYDLDALYDLLNAQLAEYNNQYDSLMANLMANFTQNNASLDDYYNQVLALLGNNYADTESYLNSQLGNSQQALEDDRRRALQEAYIARMMQEKQLRDQLDAYGLTGGASESVMANLMNNYMNNRAGVEEKTQSLLKDLLQNYIGNISNARQNYNQALMNAAQNQMNARQNYANNLAEAQTNAASYLANARSGAYENLYNTLAKLALQ